MKTVIPKPSILPAEYRVGRCQGGIKMESPVKSQHQLGFGLTHATATLALFLLNISTNEVWVPARCLMYTP